MSFSETATKLPPTEALDFYVAELERATKEQRFGIAGVGSVTASVPPSSPGATVDVNLLEQRSIKVKLTSNGFRVSAESSMCA